MDEIGVLRRIVKDCFRVSKKEQLDLIGKILELENDPSVDSIEMHKNTGKLLLHVKMSEGHYFSSRE